MLVEPEFGVEDNQALKIQILKNTFKMSHIQNKKFTKETHVKLSLILEKFQK